MPGIKDKRVSRYLSSKGRKKQLVLIYVRFSLGIITGLSEHLGKGSFAQCSNLAEADPNGEE